MIKKNDIYPTDGLKFGVSKQHGPWAMMKALGDRPGNIVSVFITNPEEIRGQAAQLTEDDLKRDYRYHMAVKITERLLEEGRITPEEYERICREHIRKYCPTLAPVMA